MNFRLVVLWLSSSYSPIIFVLCVKGMNYKRDTLDIKNDGKWKLKCVWCVFSSSIVLCRHKLKKAFQTKKLMYPFDTMSVHCVAFYVVDLSWGSDLFSLRLFICFVHFMFELPKNKHRKAKIKKFKIFFCLSLDDSNTLGLDNILHIFSQSTH